MTTIKIIDQRVPSLQKQPEQEMELRITNDGVILFDSNHNTLFSLNTDNKQVYFNPKPVGARQKLKLVSGYSFTYDIVDACVCE